MLVCCMIAVVHTEPEATFLSNFDRQIGSSMCLVSATIFARWLLIYILTVSCSVMQGLPQSSFVGKLLHVKKSWKKCAKYIHLCKVGVLSKF